MQLEWARAIAQQCADAGVPVFVKQMGAAYARAAGFGQSKGGGECIPADLRVFEKPW